MYESGKAVKIAIGLQVRCAASIPFSIPDKKVNKCSKPSNKKARPEKDSQCTGKFRLYNPRN